MKTINITSELKRFDKHLKNNPRTIFSAKFGDGKTYFLNEYRKKHEKDTLFIVLHPINYSVETNEDVFEYIKRDILVELVKLKEFKEVDWKEVAKTLFSYDNLLETNKELADALPETFGIKPLAKAVLIPFQWFKKVDDTYAIDKFFERFEDLQGSIFEQDHFTIAIQETIKRIQETGRKCVLIIEDLDRVDPGHLFRILNVLGAHIDEDENTNKFGFNNIVAVLDYKKTEHIFYHFYGKEANYSGYMAKFICQNIFEYSILQEARNQLTNYVKEECKLDDNAIISYDWGISTDARKNTIRTRINEMSLRDIVRALEVKNISMEDEVVNDQNQKVHLQSAAIIKLLRLFVRMDMRVTYYQFVQFFISSKERFELLGSTICSTIVFHHKKLVFTNGEQEYLYYKTQRDNYVEPQFWTNGSSTGTLEKGYLTKAMAEVMPFVLAHVDDGKMVIE